MTPAATTRVKLADVADIVMGQSPPSTSYNVDGIGLPFLQGKAEFGALSPQPVKWCTDPKKIAEPGCVLLSVRAPVGDVNISDQRYCIGRGLAALVPGDNLDGQFLYYQLLTLRRWLNSQSSGSTFQSINSGVLYNLTLDLPDIQEQRRTARILSTIQSSDASRRSESAHLAEVRRSLIENFFSKAERTIRLSSLIERPQYGFTASASKEGALRFLRITDIQDQGINWDAVPSCDPLPPAGDRYELEDGDLVVARIGATTGKAWLIRNPPASVFASYLIRIRARSEVDPRFLGAFFETRAYWSQIDSAKGSRLKGGVNIENLNSLTVPYLPPSSQRSLGEALDLIMLASNAVWKSAFATSALFGSAMANLLGSVP